MKDGFIKVSAVTPEIKVADVSYNTQSIITAMKKEFKKHTKICVFPELCLTGATCGDLFLQNSLIKAAENALFKLASASENHDMLTIVGLPFRDEANVISAAAIIQDGNVLGIVPVDSDVIIRCNQLPELTVSIGNSDNGALIVAYPDAAEETVERDDYTKLILRAESKKNNCAYIYANAGNGESTSEVVFAGRNLIVENGEVLAETPAFAEGAATSEIDIEALTFDRSDYQADDRDVNDFEEIGFELKIEKTALSRTVRKFPFIPDGADADKDFERILDIQTRGLMKRLQHINCKNVELGISGGLDSTLALIIAVRAFDALKISRKNIYAITMPCFGTSQRTHDNAVRLAKSFGVKFKEINIADSVTLHLKDIDHKISDRNVAYENAQARERTQILMDIANDENGLVIGTGDMSEIALGFATYNGDHMSMYAVNASVTKTLMRKLVTYYADNCGDRNLKETLYDVVLTPVSPELLPPVKGKISQKTEDLVGPYELHDFYIYYAIRYGFGPAKIFRLAQYAWGDEYDNATIYKWLESFYRRFFASQFKRSCMPDGPKVGEISLSSHSDLMIPSDACKAVWMEELASIKF